MLAPVEFIVWEKCGHGVLFQRFDDYNDAILRHIARNPIQSGEDDQNEES
mgnify:CR=1 FL=1